MPDYEDHADVIDLLYQSQQADYDMRQQAKDAELFITAIDGMWEPYWLKKVQAQEKPAFTFDATTPIINQIAGEIEKANFNVQIRPVGAGATKDIARTMEGLVRHIETISNAQDIYNAAARAAVTPATTGGARSSRSSSSTRRSESSRRGASTPRRSRTRR